MSKSTLGLLNVPGLRSSLSPGYSLIIPLVRSTTYHDVNTQYNTHTHTRKQTHTTLSLYKISICEWEYVSVQFTKYPFPVHKRNVQCKHRPLYKTSPSKTDVYISDTHIAMILLCFSSLSSCENNFPIPYKTTPMVFLRLPKYSQGVNSIGCFTSIIIKLFHQP